MLAAFETRAPRSSDKSRMPGVRRAIEPRHRCFRLSLRCRSGRFSFAGFLNRWRLLVATMHKAVLLLGSSTRLLGQQYADRFAIRRSVTGVVRVVDRGEGRRRSMRWSDHSYFRSRRSFPQRASYIR